MTRWLALFLTFLTGFSGLAYEVAWEKYLATLLGSHSEATASVLAIFLGGLSVGYWLFGAVTRRVVAGARRAGRPPRLLLLYGAIEAGIGLYVLCFPWLFRVAQSISIALPGGSQGLGFALDVGLAALLIGPPTILMGGTIPILTQALARSLDDATRFHAFVYAFNTAGAFLGALGAGFLLIPELGLVKVMLAMGSINLVAGSVFALIGLRGREIADLGSPGGGSGRIDGFATYAAVALLIGFAMMAFQTIMIRVGGFSLGSSQFTFSMVVAVFVLCIAIGSFAVSAFPRVPPVLLPAAIWGLAILLFLLYGVVENLPYWGHVLRSMFRDHDPAFYPYQIAVFAGLLATIGAPVVLSGATLPLLFHELRREVGELGASAGTLYSWNTVGSLLGALLGGYVLLFWLDLHHVYRIALAAVAVSGLLLAARSSGRPLVALGVGIPMLIGLTLLEPWRPNRLSLGAFRIRHPTPVSYGGADFFAGYRERKTLFYDDDPNASIWVIEASDGSRSLATNGKVDGNTDGDVVTMVLTGILPAIFAESTERVFVVGLGTGMTVGELAALPETREVVVAEISPAIADAAPLFDFATHDASKNPKVRVVRSDAFRELLRSPDARYDIIASEPSNPWVTGVEMLYSREFLEAARDRLAPGGVYCQWFHEYEMDDETIELVLRTYASVFDQIAVWYAQGPDLLLLGFGEGTRPLDLAHLQERASLPAVRAALDRAGIESFPALLAHELMPLGVAHAAKLEGPIQTLLHPRLNHQAGRSFFRGARARLPFTGFGPAARVGARNSLLRRYRARAGDRMTEDAEAQVVLETCKHRENPCVALLADWLQRYGRTPRFEAILAEARKLQDIPEAALQRLDILSGDPIASTGIVRVPRARLASADFRDFYHHAVPFDPRGLLGAWERCRAPKKPGLCKAGLANARGLVVEGRIPTSAAAAATPKTPAPDQGRSG